MINITVKKYHKYIILIMKTNNIVYEIKYNTSVNVFDNDRIKDYYKKYYDLCLIANNNNFINGKIILEPLYCLLLTNDDNIKQEYRTLLKKYEVHNLSNYIFGTKLSYLFYNNIAKKKYIEKNDKILIFAKNIYLLDVIIYFKKYVLFDNTNSNINIFFREDTLQEGSIEYAKKNKIGYNILPNELNNNRISDMSTKISNIDVIIIDLNILNIDAVQFRSYYGFQAILSYFLMSITKLNMGGNIYFCVPIYGSKLVHNFFELLKLYFANNYVEYSFKNIYPDCIQFYYTNYNKKIDTNIFLKVNEENYKIDKTGGLKFCPNKEESEYFGIKYNKCTNKNLEKFIVINNDSFEKYSGNIIKHINISIQHLQEVYYTKFEDITIMENKFKNTINDTKNILEDIGLLSEWVERPTNKLNYYDTNYRIFYSNTKSYNKKFYNTNINTIISINENIDIYNADYLYSIYKMNEIVYSYIDQLDQKKWKSIELFFNNNQKNLSKFLKTEYDININNKYVSRAWIKMTEIINKTQLFDNNNKYTSLHICEAPGNFVNACNYYVNHILKKKYDWTAQSWKGGDIWDTYGFIKKTNISWDLGKDNTGNIMDSKNLKYYYEKYKHVENLISDCGIPWMPSNKGKKNLSVYQLFYALLVPNKNFVIKTYANVDPLFIAWLYVISCKYEKLYIFRSSRNMWSSEIYFIGKNKKELSTEEINNIFICAQNYDNNKLIYPVKRIPAEFLYEYEYHSQILGKSFTSAKKFFSYLARNDALFEDKKDELERMINRRNYIWLQKYFTHLPSTAKKYKLMHNF
jgi:hypothetical protein